MHVGDTRYKYFKIASTLLAVVLFLIAAAFTVMKMGMLKPEERVELAAPQKYDKTIKVVGYYMYPPYSFIAKDKSLQGYEVELMYAIGHKLGYNVDIKLEGWQEWQNALNGKTKNAADIFCGVDIMLNMEDYHFVTSMPTSADNFTYFGSDSLESIYDTWNKRIGYTSDIPQSSLKHTRDIYEYKSVFDAFEALTRKEIDYVYVRASVGRRIAKRYNNIYNCVKKEPGYTSYIGFAAASDKAALMEEINSAIEALRKDGTIGRLQRKWLHDYYQHYTLGQVIKENQATYLVFLLVLLVYMFFTLTIYLLQKEGQHEQLRQRLENENIKQQIEVQTLESQLMLSQIHPHFLYNVLNSIAALCDFEPQRARRMTLNFAEYLRGNLQTLQSKDLIWISKEIEHVEFYLKLEKERLEDKLDYAFEINCKNFKLPALTLQPLVENAVKHGIRYKATAGKVTITTSESPEGYEIVVQDDGVGFEYGDIDFAADKHFGINNVKNRLKHLCDGSVTIASKPGEGTVVRVYIPKRK